MNLWEEFLSKAVSDIAKKEANLVLLGIPSLVFVILLGKSRQDCIGVMECMFSSTSHKELKSCDADVIHYSFIKISTSSRTNGKAGGLFSFLLIILDYNAIINVYILNDESFLDEFELLFSNAIFRDVCFSIYLLPVDTLYDCCRFQADCFYYGWNGESRDIRLNWIEL